MTPFHAVLVLATFLCSLVAGFLFAFSVVIMPGLKTLDDGAFIRSFQVIDRVIQNNQPLFILVWIGSVVSVLMAAVMGVWQLHGIDRLLLIIPAIVHVLGVQLTTFRINVPLNNQLQRLDSLTMTAAALLRSRNDFEVRWNRSNLFRTACASFAAVVLMIVLLRI